MTDEKNETDPRADAVQLARCVHVGNYTAYAAIMESYLPDSMDAQHAEQLGNLVHALTHLTREALYTDLQPQPFFDDQHTNGITGLTRR